MPFDGFDQMLPPGQRRRRPQPGQPGFDDLTLRGPDAGMPPPQVITDAPDALLRGPDAARAVRMLTQGTDEPGVLNGQAMAAPLTATPIPDLNGLGAAQASPQPSVAMPDMPPPNFDRTLFDAGNAARQEATGRDFAQGLAESGQAGVQSRKGILTAIDPGNQLTRQGFFPDLNLQALQLQGQQADAAVKEAQFADKQAVAREGIASEERWRNQQHGAKAINDKFRQGVLADLFNSNEYKAADPELKKQMEAQALDRARLGYTSGDMPPPGQPAAPVQPKTLGPKPPGGPDMPPPPGAAAPPPGASPPADPLQARVDAEARLATERALANAPVNQALERIKSALVVPPAAGVAAPAPGQRPMAPTYAYDPTKAAAVLDAMMSSGLTPEQRANLLDRVGSLPGVDYQKLGDELVKATTGSLFSLTPNTGGRNSPATITSPDIPGLTVGGDDDAGWGMMRWLSSGFNPGALYNNASIYGRSVPLTNAQAGFQRAALSLPDAEMHKNRVRAAAQLLPFLNQRGLYGERSLPAPR